jgi:hypothetical protein
MMRKGLGEALWREKEKLALAWLEETLPTLKGPLTSDARAIGVSIEILSTKKAQHRRASIALFRFGRFMQRGAIRNLRSTHPLAA